MKIGHYAPDIWARGGIANYIGRLGEAQTEAGNAVFYFSRVPASSRVSGTHRVVEDDLDLFRQARQVDLDILHLHKPVSVLPRDRVPTARTMHGNQGSCPSGTRYLARSGQPCDRLYSVTGCLWGHLVDRCGGRRPGRVRASFESIRQEQRLASELHTFTVSQFLKDQMVRSGCPADKIHTLLSPAPEVEEAFVPPPHAGTPRFLFLGRIVPQKGLEWLLRAVAEVKMSIHLDIAGDGYLMNDMQRLSAALGLTDRVTFHGWLSPTDVDALIKTARAVVFPSVWHEPAGLVTLEAAASGRPVIASRVGGIPEYAASGYVLLVSPNDVEGLAGSITRLADDRELAEHMGRSGKKLIQTRFSMDQFMHKLDQLYVLVINEISKKTTGYGRAHIAPTPLP